MESILKRRKSEISFNFFLFQTREQERNFYNIFFVIFFAEFFFSYFLVDGKLKFIFFFAGVSKYFFCIFQSLKITGCVFLLKYYNISHSDFQVDFSGESSKLFLFVFTMHAKNSITVHIFYCVVVMLRFGVYNSYFFHSKFQVNFQSKILVNVKRDFCCFQSQIKIKRRKHSSFFR